MATFKAKFAVGNRVAIDSQTDIVGVVTEVAFRKTDSEAYVIYQVDWLHNGTNGAYYIAEWRLKLMSEA
jgi:hypothetical protein